MLKIGFTAFILGMLGALFGNPTVGSAPTIVATLGNVMILISLWFLLKYPSGAGRLVRAELNLKRKSRLLFAVLQIAKLFVVSGLFGSVIMHLGLRYSWGLTFYLAAFALIVADMLRSEAK